MSLFLPDIVYPVILYNTCQVPAALSAFFKVSFKKPMLGYVKIMSVMDRGKLHKDPLIMIGTKCV